MNRQRSSFITVNSSSVKNPSPFSSISWNSRFWSSAHRRSISTHSLFDGSSRTVSKRQSRTEMSQKIRKRRRRVVSRHRQSTSKDRYISSETDFFSYHIRFDFINELFSVNSSLSRENCWRRWTSRTFLLSIETCQCSENGSFRSRTNRLDSWQKLRTFTSWLLVSWAVWPWPVAESSSKVDKFSNLASRRTRFHWVSYLRFDLEQWNLPVWIAFFPRWEIEIEPSRRIISWARCLNDWPTISGCRKARNSSGSSSLSSARSASVHRNRIFRSSRSTEKKSSWWIEVRVDRFLLPSLVKGRRTNSKTSDSLIELSFRLWNLMYKTKYSCQVTRPERKRIEGAKWKRFCRTVLIGIDQKEKLQIFILRFFQMHFDVRHGVIEKFVFRQKRIFVQIGSESKEKRSDRFSPRNFLLGWPTFEIFRRAFLSVFPGNFEFLLRRVRGSLRIILCENRRWSFRPVRSARPQCVSLLSVRWCRNLWFLFRFASSWISSALRISE